MKGPCGFFIESSGDFKGDRNDCNHISYLTILRFVDDVWFIAKGKEEFSQMLPVIKKECANAGLEMHSQKTKILTNGVNDEEDKRTDIIKGHKENNESAQKGNTKRMKSKI